MKYLLIIFASIALVSTSSAQDQSSQTELKRVHISMEKQTLPSLNVEPIGASLDLNATTAKSELTHVHVRQERKTQPENIEPIMVKVAEPAEATTKLKHVHIIMDPEKKSEGQNTRATEK